jgi:hypothetical protein
MRYQGMLRVVMVGVLAFGVGVAAAGTAWAQQTIAPAPPPGATPPPASDSPGVTAMAALAGAMGSFFYIPFKVGAMCPGMALASGASLAVTGGNKDTAEYLLRVGCTGTYFITPGMVRGQEEFQGSGAR